MINLMRKIRYADLKPFFSAQKDPSLMNRL